MREEDSCFSEPLKFYWTRDFKKSKESKKSEPGPPDDKSQEDKTLTLCLKIADDEAVQTAFFPLFVRDCSFIS